MSVLRKWNPNQPRWPKGSGKLSGRWRPKASHSVRLSSRSVSYNSGFRVRVSPKVAVYVGGIARVERVNTGGSVLDKYRDKVASKVRKSGRRGSGFASDLLSNKSADRGGIRITRSNVISSPTFRASNAPAQERRRGEYIGEINRGEVKRKVTASRTTPVRVKKARPQRRAAKSNLKAISAGTKVKT